MATTQLSPMTAIRLVAGRELSVHLRNKATIISTLVFVALIIGGLIVANIFSAQEKAVALGVVPDTEDVGQATVSILEAQDISTSITTFDNDADARTAVSDGNVDAFLTGTGTDITAVVKESLDSDISTAVASILQQTRIANLAQEAGSPPKRSQTRTPSLMSPPNRLTHPRKLKAPNTLLDPSLGFCSTWGFLAAACLSPKVWWKKNRHELSKFSSPQCAPPNSSLERSLALAWCP